MHKDYIVIDNIMFKRTQPFKEVKKYIKYLTEKEWDFLRGAKPKKKIVEDVTEQEKEIVVDLKKEDNDKPKKKSSHKKKFNK